MQIVLRPKYTWKALRARWRLPIHWPHRWVLKQDPVSCKKMSATYITLYRTFQPNIPDIQSIQKWQAWYIRGCMLGAEGMKVYYSPALRGFGVSGQRCNCRDQLFSLRNAMAVWIKRKTTDVPRAEVMPGRKLTCSVTLENVHWFRGKLADDTQSPCTIDLPVPLILALMQISRHSVLLSLVSC